MSLLLAACAVPSTRPAVVDDGAVRAEAEKEKDLAVREIVAERIRLARVYRRLATKAHRFCGRELAASTGAAFASSASGSLGSAYARLYGVAARPTVLFVLEGSPAAAAGLREHDIVTRIENRTVASMDDFDAIYRALTPTRPIRMEVERDGAISTLALNPDAACKYPAVLQAGLAPDAYADGAQIMVTRGMMAFARNDFELSLVLAHELAHNVMRHMEAKQRNAAADFFARILTAAKFEGGAWSSLFSASDTQVYSQEFEAEADYVGLYMLAAAGLPLDDAASFWRRLAAANPSNIDGGSSSSHHSVPYRLLALQATAREIKRKIEIGAPLEPNMREGEIASWRH